MKINSISGINLKSIMTNKTVLKGLEKISEHGTSFAAVTSLGMSLVVRPLAIFATPRVERENKEYASVSSISSGIVKFGMVEAVALPIENAVKRIDRNPAKYLKPETITSLAPSVEKITDAKAYRVGTQIIKLGSGTLSAIPKSLLTISLIPVIMDNLLHRKKHEVNVESENYEKNLKTVFAGNDKGYQVREEYYSREYQSDVRPEAVRRTFLQYDHAFPCHKCEKRGETYNKQQNFKRFFH